jgi:cytochrome c
VGGPDGKLRVWSLETRKQLTAERAAHAGPVADVAVSPDRKTVISIDEAGLAKVWPAGGGDAAAEAATGVSRLAGLAADNARFAVCSADGAVAVYDFAGKPVRSWTVRGKPAAIAFPGDGRRLAVGLSDGTIFLLELP